MRKENMDMSSGDDEVECPKCGQLVARKHFCANCGYDFTQLEMEVCEHGNLFEETDSNLLDLLLYNVKIYSKENGRARRPENGPGTVRALGDIIGLPSDYPGTVYSTGNIVFANEPPSEFTLGYHDGQNQRFLRTYSFRKALVMKRVPNEGYISIQTDTDSYRILPDELDIFTIRMISRTPVVILKEGGLCYVMCKNKGCDRYLHCQDEDMEPKEIWRIQRGEKYGISQGWFFNVRYN